MNEHICDACGNLVCTITNIRIDLPENVRLVLNMLYSNGFSAYVVGGCCRDAILRREPNDWDVATSALPEQVMEVFKDMKLSLLVCSMVLLQ